MCELRPGNHARVLGQPRFVLLAFAYTAITTAIRNHRVKKKFQDMRWIVFI